eukprot:756440-Hanusia_phi.AAC.5
MIGSEPGHRLKGTCSVWSCFLLGRWGDVDDPFLALSSAMETGRRTRMKQKEEERRRGGLYVGGGDER